MKTVWAVWTVLAVLAAYVLYRMISSVERLTDGVVPELVIVSSHYKEDLEWLRSQKSIPFVVCSKTLPSPQCDVKVNKGREVSSYLKYIIDNWDSLPQYVAFVHGHETAWHQEYENLLEVIKCAKYKEHDFISLNHKYIDDRRFDENHPMFEFWKEHFEPFLKRPMPKYVLHDCCAQFIVAKSRIRANTLEAYKHWYKVTTTTEAENEWQVSVWFEYMWHVIFGEPDVVSERENRDRFDQACLKKLKPNTMAPARAAIVSVCKNPDDIDELATMCASHGIKLIVFDKCGGCPDVKSVKCTPLENIGREQHTFLKYVIDNYDALPDEIFFVPAPTEKYDRIGNFKKMLADKNYRGPCTPLGGQENFVLEDYTGLKLRPADTRPFKAWFEKNVGEWKDDALGPCWNGITRTTRDRARRRSLDSYRKILREHKVNDEEVVHFMERSMAAVFG